MANIVELREMSNDKLQELLENAREEMFNLRFQNASARLEDYSRLQHVRREIARLESLLHMRSLAKDSAVAMPEITAALAGRKWRANARFSYEDSVWLVEFVDEDGSELASAMVNLNRKRAAKGSARRRDRRSLVTSYKIAG
jgi:large subunit ribosomal protein L29